MSKKEQKEPEVDLPLIAFEYESLVKDGEIVSDLEIFMKALAKNNEIILWSSTMSPYEVSQKLLDLGSNIEDCLSGIATKLNDLEIDISVSTGTITSARTNLKA